jgi:hypothetical protein
VRFAAVSLVTLTLIAGGAPAQAGTYDVWGCAGPAGEPLPATGWTPQSRGGTVNSTCGVRGGSFSASLNPGEVASGSFARWTFEAPKDTTVAGVTIHRVASASGNYGAWWRSYFLFRDSPLAVEGYGLDVCAYLTSPCAKPGDPASPLSAANQYTSPAISAGRLIASAQCDGSQPCPPQDPATAGSFAIYRAQVALADAFPPTFPAPPTGSLLDVSGVIGGDRAASFQGSDLGGGISAAEVVIDGTPVARSPIADGATCRTPYSSPVPCPLTAAGTISLDTATLSNGRHVVQVALVDAASNRTLSDPVIVAIHNDKRPNGVNASRIARLRARFLTRGRRARAERRVEFGERATVIGRLVNDAGAPIRRAQLRITSRIDRLGEREREIARIRTKKNGRFRWRPPVGPSRFLRVTYRAYRSDAHPTAATELKLSVRSAIGLRVSPRRVRNGGRILFKGHLIGGPGRAGTQVVLEAVGRRVRQRVPVATLRTDARGRFRFRYRFLRSFAPFTYRFRARVISQASYPYAGGSSRIVTVRIVR